MIALLDVNVLIALVDPGHKFHRTAKAWALAKDSSAWASCPLTQNGCIRIIGVLDEFQERDVRCLDQSLAKLAEQTRFHFEVQRPLFDLRGLSH